MKAQVLLPLFLACLLQPDSTVQVDEVAELIRGLGADSIEARELASRGLMELGEKALPSLRRLAKADQGEASARARDLIRHFEKSLEGTVGACRGTEGRSGAFEGAGVPESPKFQWQYESADAVYAPPTVAGDHLYFGGSSKAKAIGGIYSLHCIERRTGVELWKSPLGEHQAFTSTAVSREYVAIGAAQAVFLFERGRGGRRWSFETGGLILSAPVISGGLVLFGSRDGFFYAVDLETGLRRWAFPAGSPVFESAAVEAGRVFLVTDGQLLIALDRGSGRELWRIQSKRRIGTPVASDGRVFVGGDEFRLEVFEAATGKPLWSFVEEKWSPVADYAYMGEPAVKGNRVFVASRRKAVYALETATGVLLWSTETRAEIDQPPALAGGTLHLLGKWGDLFAIDTETGKERWRRQVGRANRGPVLNGDTLYVADCYGKLVYALK